MIGFHHFLYLCARNGVYCVFSVLVLSRDILLSVKVYYMLTHFNIDCVLGQEKNVRIGLLLLFDVSKKILSEVKTSFLACEVHVF